MLWFIMLSALVLFNIFTESFATLQRLFRGIKIWKKIKLFVIL